MVGSFETGFHSRMPRRAYLYGLPYEWYEKYGIRRYGFHGASHQFVTERVAQLLGSMPSRLITCHLGGSSSLAAVRDGVSIDTSFGFALQSGVEHSYRCGDIDSFIMPYLTREIGLSYEEVEEGMTKRGGLAGHLRVVAMRDLEEAAAAGHDRAEAALEVFAYGVKKYIGATRPPGRPGYRALPAASERTAQRCGGGFSRPRLPGMELDVRKGTLPSSAARAR